MDHEIKFQNCIVVRNPILLGFILFRTHTCPKSRRMLPTFYPELAYSLDEFPL